MPTWTTSRTNAEAATATNARSAAVVGQPRTREPEEHDQRADRDDADGEGQLREVIDDPALAFAEVVLDLHTPPYAPSPLSRPSALRSLVGDVADRRAGRTAAADGR